MARTAIARRPEIRPQAGPQTAFLTCNADIALYGGAAGGGKTYALLIDALRAASVPQGKAVLFRRMTPQIRSGGALWDTAVSIYSKLPGVRMRESVLDFRFPNNGRITLSHMEKEVDRQAWQGAQVEMIGWDELTHFTERQFWYVTLSRGRGMTDIVPWTRATCNPCPADDPVGGWVNKFIEWWWDWETGYAIPERSGVIRYFYRIAATNEDEEDEILWYDSVEHAKEANPLIAEEVDPISFTFIRSRLEDNPALLEKNPGYKSKLFALGHVEKEQLAKGNWKVREKVTGIIWTAPETILYNDEDPRFAAIKSELYSKAPLIGGWDFGSGTSLLCNLWVLLEMSPKPTFWLDAEITWQQTGWRYAASDSIETFLGYCDERGERVGPHFHFGDPAGANRESDQSSWILNLRRGGVPLNRLDAIYNTKPQIEWGIKQVQLLISDGRLRIHKRCEYIFRCLRNWRRNVPENIAIDFVSKKYFDTRKDVYSHGGMALVYLVAGAMGYIKSVKRSRRGIPASPPSLPISAMPASPHPKSLGVAPILRVLPRRPGGNVVSARNIRSVLGR